MDGDVDGVEGAMGAEGVVDGAAGFVAGGAAGGVASGFT